MNTCLEAVSGSSQKPFSHVQLIEWLENAPSKVILVDNTSSEELAMHYPHYLAKGISIVTPNKKAFSADYSHWEKIWDAAHSSGAQLFHESTVGAGLPTVSTLRDIIDTGDKVTKIEGVFSGTLSYLFNLFSPTQGSGGKWSEVVIKAKELGYTEPDPRDDLSGLDVARKLTILARIAGLEVTSPDSFPVQSLIPSQLKDCPREQFLQRLPEFDAEMEQLKAEADKEGKVLRFVGKLDMTTKTLKVGVEKFDKSHPIAGLKGAENIFSFHTERYHDGGLKIQGPGAGGELTAMGITSDFIKVLRHIS